MTIKELRTKEGLSQSEMAKRLGIATSAIGHMENGRMKVSPKIAAKAKEEFGVDLDIEPKAAKKPVKEKVKAAEDKVEKAAKTTDNAFAASYLLKAGIAAEAAGDSAKALSFYKTIKEKWMAAPEAMEIDKYISRIQTAE